MGLRGGNSPTNSSQSRISAWFAALVVLAGSVFLLEYVVFFNASSSRGGSGDMGGGQQGTAPAAWRLAHPPAHPQEPDAVAAAPQAVAKAAELRAAAPGSSSSFGADSLEEEEKSGVMVRAHAAAAAAARRLAVVVPAHAGDLGKALSSLATWPTTCHSSTLVNADLILYYAGGEEDDVAAVLPALAQTGGRCFANTRLVLANLTPEVSLLNLPLRVFLVCRAYLFCGIFLST